MSNEQKLREALLSDMDIAVLRMPVRMAFAGDMAQFQYHNRVQALLNRIEALAMQPDVPETNFGKLREVLQLIAWSNDSKWQADCARQALALPTADHIPDAGKMIETAEPVGERERFEAWWRTVQMRTFPKEYDIKRLQDWGSAYKPKALEAWQARAALSAGDAAVLAEREACAKLCEEVADDLITAMRKDGETDDEAMTSIVAPARVCAEEIRGGYSKKFNPHNAAIDAAMRKDQP